MNSFGFMRLGVRLLSVAGAWAFALGGLCACSSGNDNPVCVANSLAACLCGADPTPYTMQCAADGSGYRACDCPISTVGAVATSGGTIPTTGGIVPTSGGTIPTSGGTVPTSGGTVPTSGGTAAATGGTATGGGTGGDEPGLPAHADVVFSKNIRLNDDTGRSNQTEVALAAGPDGLLLAGWMDERAERVCAYSFSKDGGDTWSKNVTISNVSSFVGDPAVAIDGAGTMYAICHQYGAKNIRMMTSVDKGEHWSAVTNIQSAPDKPWAAGGTEAGTVFVSWLGNPGGIKRSTDYGVTWGKTQSTGNIIHGTAIATSNTGLVHVPYNLDSNRNQLRYLRSRDNGDTYEAARDLIPDMGTFCFNCSPRQHPIVGAACDPTGQFVAITWTSRMAAGEGDDDVWLLYSRDGGDTWTAPIRVNDNTSRSRQIESWVAVDAQGWVHVAWSDFRDGKNDTYYARSADPSKGFEPNIKINDGAGGSVSFLGDYKGIVVQGADVLVVWQDTRSDQGDIYFARAPGAAAAAP